MAELHKLTLGADDYWLRAPGVHDLPTISAELTRRRCRRPSLTEFRVTGLAGIAAMGEAARQPAEAERQQALFEEWHELLAPLSEDDIDEPDFEKRAAELARRGAARAEARAAIFAEITAIEANLARHWAAYADLLADRQLYDSLIDIDVVRTLLVRRGEIALVRGEDGMLTDAAYLAIPAGHRRPLALFANRLLMPDETTRKN